MASSGGPSFLDGACRGLLLHDDGSLVKGEQCQGRRGRSRGRGRAAQKSGSLTA